MVRTADAATQLMQLGQTEFLGAVDEDGVGVRVVDAGFDDRRTQQQVGSLLGKVAHDTLQLTFVQLAVADHDARFRHQLGQFFAHVFDGVDLVVQEIYLAAALQLAQHGFANDAVRQPGNEGLDGEALLRRGSNHREIAQALQRHGQRARNWRCGQRQHVDLGAKILQAFLLTYAEAVFLIDDDQAEAIELHFLGQELVRADDDVDLALRQLLHRLRGFLGRLEARNLRNTHRPVGKAVAEGQEVLFAQ